METTHFFFVRVWQHQHQFRAAVQSDNDGEPRLFTEPEQVGEFLRQAVTPKASAADREDVAPDDRSLGHSKAWGDTQRRRR